MAVAVEVFTSDEDGFRKGKDVAISVSPSTALVKKGQISTLHDHLQSYGVDNDNTGMNNWIINYQSTLTMVNLSVQRHRCNGKYEADLWDNSCKKAEEFANGRYYGVGITRMDEHAS